MNSVSLLTTNLETSLCPSCRKPLLPHNTSAITLTSSSEDEEFFSPNEEPNHIRVPSQSESSEATITSTRQKILQISNLIE